MNPATSFPTTEISLKIILSLGVGLLVGLEREFSSKDVGVRTFSLTSLFGLLCQLIDTQFAVAGLIAILVVTVFMNGRAVLVNRSLEITTSVAMLVTYCLGNLVANGHVFSPVAIAILMTMLLAWKTELAAFAHGLKLAEIRSAVTLALLTFVIYPILPNSHIDPWGLVNPKEAWITIIVLAAISFVNYILLKIYSTRGLYYSALLGGAVNSSAAVTEISVAVRDHKGTTPTYALPILLMTTISMFIRNLVLLGIFEPEAIPMTLAPLLGMIITAVFFIWKARANHEGGVTPTAPLKVSSPVSMRRVLTFGVLFVALQALGTLAVRYLGSAGVLSVSFLGGFVSSASSAAAAAKLGASGKITAGIAGVAVILTSISSAFVNLPLVLQTTKDKELTKKLGWATVICVVSGLILMAIVAWFQGIL